MLLPVPNAKVPTNGKGSYLYQRSDNHKHQGIDLGAPEGSPVLAAELGIIAKVIAPGTRGFSGYGAAVVIEHDIAPRATRVWTLYAHLKPGSVIVREGERVTRGQKTAEVGASCGTVEDPHRQCGGPHLHFEVSPLPYPRRSEASRVDPTFFLRTA